MKLKEAKKLLEEAKANNSRYWIKHYSKIIDDMTGKNKVVEVEYEPVKEENND